MKTKHHAIYVRVSTGTQDTASQKADLQAWAAASTLPVVWYSDKSTGTSMERPAWANLVAAMGRGEVTGIVVWRLDRLGRTASGLTKLFDEIIKDNINLISIKDGIDLTTPAGRLMANVLASVAQFETEVRGERVAAGIAAARANGKTWGGSEAGVPKKVKPKHRRMVANMRAANTPVAAIARAVGLSRSTVYKLIDELEVVNK